MGPSVRGKLVVEGQLVGCDLELAAARGSEHEVVVPDEPLQRNSWVPLLGKAADSRKWSSARLGRSPVCPQGAIAILVVWCMRSDYVDGASPSFTFIKGFDLSKDNSTLYVADAGSHKVRKVAVATSARWVSADGRFHTGRSPL